MNRKEFLQLASMLGVALPFSTAANACTSHQSAGKNSMKVPGKVLIIGSGPAGMTAGYLLVQRGVAFQILEALPTFGGRIKHNTSFTNFPISLGAEWMHVANSGRNILPEIVNDSSVEIMTQTQGYDLRNNSSGYYDGTSLILDSLGNHFGRDFVDRKFVGSSWLDFFTTYIYPSVSDKIVYNTPVTQVDYNSDKVVLTAKNGATFTADKVIVTIPVKMLQSGMINFTPSLPSNKQQALRNIKVWGGFKAFFKFTTKFYPTYLSFPESASPRGQWHYYDAAFAQNTTDHILGLFATGEPAEAYQKLTGDAQRDYILRELDTIFGSQQASANYVEHIVQDWNKEPYAQGAYVTAYEKGKDVEVLGRSVHDRLYFAGDGYTRGYDWSSVHAAARSAKRAVEALVS